MKIVLEIAGVSMKERYEQIITTYESERAFWGACGWIATYDGYDGAPDSNCPYGQGDTEQEAINDLIEITEFRNERKS